MKWVSVYMVAVCKIVSEIRIRIELLFVEGKCELGMSRWGCEGAVRESGSAFTTDQQRA